MKHTFYIALTLLIFTSCTKEVEIDIPGYAEELVIDGVIETNAPPFVMISKTKDIYAPTDIDAFLNGFVSGATVTVSDGTNTVVLDEWCSDNLPPGAGPIAAQMFGISESELANYHICAYLTLDPSMSGQVGKTYQLTVELDGNTYQASTAIVQPTYFDSVWWKPEPSTPNHGFSWVYLTDPPTKGDAYKWEVKRINIGMDGEPIDQNFKVPFSPVFNDQFFNGLAFEFAYENPFAFETETPEEYLGAIIGDLNSRRGQVSGTETRGPSTVINSMVPLANMFRYVNNLRSMSQGRAVFTMQFDHYEEVPKAVSEEIISKLA